MSSSAKAIEMVDPRGDDAPSSYHFAEYAGCFAALRRRSAARVCVLDIEGDGREPIPMPAVDLDDRARQGLARLLPSLLCGEESAAITFARESIRFGSPADGDIRAALKGIAREEAIHERLLRGLSAALPPAPDLEEIRSNARRFYVAMARSGEVSDHFARIAELDSCVCVLLSAFLRSRAARCDPVGALFRRIRQDEVRHVATSRRYLDAMGTPTESVMSASEWVRPELVRLLVPVGGAFDDIGVDPEALFHRLQRGRDR